MSRKSETRTILGIHFLGLADVAARLRVGRQAVLREIASGRLSAKKIGGSWHVTELWLDEYLSTPDVGPDTNVDLKNITTDAQLRQVIRKYGWRSVSR